MKISKNSYHYRLFETYGFGKTNWRGEVNICQYFWRLILGILVVLISPFTISLGILIILELPLVLIFNYLFIGTFVGFFDGVNMFLAFSIVLYILSFIGVCIWLSETFISYTTGKLCNKLDEGGNKITTFVNLLKVYKKSWKEKFCVILKAE